MTRRHGWVLIAPLAASMASGCTFAKDLGSLDTDGPSDGSADRGDGDGGSADGGGGTDAGDTADGGDADGGGDDQNQMPDNPPAAAVDILFVVDNSGSMGQEQGLLAGPMYALTEPLMQAGISYRVAVTTSDAGNPWCPSTTPENGAFVMSSCRQRTDDFLFEGAQTVEHSEDGCLNVCALEELPLTATTTHLDSTPQVRPWVEWSGPDNLNTPGLAPSQVLSCALPQGINGCGFEQPLETMRNALLLSGNAVTPEYGFVRPDANLLVVFVTDEADCSYNPVHEEIFLPEGNRIFWSVPDDPAPSSSVCWNAGVECTGDPALFDECHPVDRTVDGDITLATPDAVLRPVSRYVDTLQQQQLQKSAGQVRVMAFVGRSSDGGDFVYSNVGDDAFLNDFGTGPGCTGEVSMAVPPVRIRAVANAINPTPDEGLYSVCGDDYAPALAAMATEIISWAP